MKGQANRKGDLSPAPGTAAMAPGNQHKVSQLSSDTMTPLWRGFSFAF